MISLLEIAHNITEADVDDDKIIKYKNKDGESKEMKASSAKKMDKEHPAKIAYDKIADKGDDSEKDSGSKLGGGDFDRDGGDEPDMDSDDDMDDEDMDDDKGASEKENENIEKELQDIAKDKGLTVGSEEANHGGEIHGLVGKDDDPDNVLGFHAAPKFDDDGNETGEVQYAIELGMGSSPIYFDNKEEAEAALKKIVDDQTVRDSMDGESDPPGVYLSDLEDHVKNVLKSDDDESKPIPAAGTKDDEPTHEEIIQYIEDEGYGGDAIGPDGNPTPEAYEDAKEELMAMKKKNEIRVINGVKYRAIKESKKPKKHILKENYDRFFGDK